MTTYLETPKQQTQLWIWRHPRPGQVKGRCIGQTDVQADPRKARRLARQMDRHARRHGLVRHVFTSHLSRSFEVGRHLRKLGWRHEVDARLSELDFGDWDGRRWDEIGAEAVQAWCQDFDQHRPGGGESVALLRERCVAFMQSLPAGGTACAVGHAGWINLARLCAQGNTGPMVVIEWAKVVAYEEGLCLSFTSGLVPNAPASL
jgi:alpha-ribazole phosphatase